MAEEQKQKETLPQKQLEADTCTYMGGGVTNIIVIKVEGENFVHEPPNLFSNLQKQTTTHKGQNSFILSLPIPSYTATTHTHTINIF